MQVLFDSGHFLKKGSVAVTSYDGDDSIMTDEYGKKMLLRFMKDCRDDEEWERDWDITLSSAYSMDDYELWREDDEDDEEEHEKQYTDYVFVIGGEIYLRNVTWYKVSAFLIYKGYTMSLIGIRAGGRFHNVIVVTDLQGELIGVLSNRVDNKNNVKLSRVILSLPEINWSARSGVDGEMED